MRTRDVVRVAQVMESLLALGHIPTSALTLTAQECPIVEPAMSAIGLGAEPGQVLVDMSRVPGQAGLSEIGHAWQVTQITGASMHAGLARVRLNLEEAADTAIVTAGELAGPRATGQLLAVLPLAGLGISAAIGSNPFGFLIGSLPGRVCLLVGVGLACAGLIWSEHLAADPTAKAARKGRL